ncbi:MAG: DUF3392 family protein [bacterium]|nr:DUF3392 family protein [bacterium]
MGFLYDLNVLAVTWVRAHLATVAMVFTTALLVVYGDNINRAVKKRVRRQHFLVRTFVFVLLCSFGYGLLTTLITPAVSRLLVLAGDRYLAVAVVMGFVVIGILADRKRYM